MMADLFPTNDESVLDLSVRRPKLYSKTTDTVSDNRTISDAMDWEEDTYVSLPLPDRQNGLFDVSVTPNEEKTLPFKKRWAHLLHTHGSYSAEDGPPQQFSLPLDLENVRPRRPVLDQKSLHSDPALPGHRTMDPDVAGGTPPQDGVTILMENLAAMHTDPQQLQQHQHRQQQQEACYAEEDEDSLDKSDLSILRSRGVQLIQPATATLSECEMTSDTEVKGSRLIQNNSDNRYVTETDVSEKQCNIIKKPDEDGDLPIHIAAVQGEFTIVARLVEMMTKTCVSIDEMNNLKQTPLHLATMTGHDDIVKLLLEAGASPNIPDRKGNTCCHQAVRKNATSCLKMIMEYSKEKANINATNFEGMTPLHEAVKHNNLDCIELLIKYGAKINMVDGKSGKTPLYLALECNKEKVAKLLLSHGADINIPTYSGCTLMQAATDKGQKLLNSNLRTVTRQSIHRATRRRQQTAKSNMMLQSFH